MAGLLAAHVLRRMRPEVHEAQPTLPNNHAALLRFRSDVCSKATGIPFRRVVVRKAMKCGHKLYTQPDIALSNMYSFKVTGKISERSIVNLESGERFVAPPDFISRLAQGINITYNSPLGPAVVNRNKDSEPVISTVPMPAMMGLIGWDHPPLFEHRAVLSYRVMIENCDVFQTIYYPGGEPYYRASITGNVLIVECLERVGPTFDAVEICESVLNDFGIRGMAVKPYGYVAKEQKYGKLSPLQDPEACRRFILYLSDCYRVYSLGRFATWRQLLLDDLVKDVSIIERMIEYRSTYEKTLAALGRTN